MNDTEMHYRIEYLEKRYGSLKLLLLLYDYGEMNFSEITKKGMVDQTLDKSVTYLERIGLVERYRKENEYHRKMFQDLTEKGKQVAKRIREIEEILDTLDINDF